MAAAHSLDDVARTFNSAQELRASYEVVLDALQAILRGFEAADGTRYAKVIDDSAMTSADQLRSLHFARGVLAEAGR